MKLILDRILVALIISMCIHILIMTIIPFPTKIREKINEYLELTAGISVIGYVISTLIWSILVIKEML